MNSPAGGPLGELYSSELGDILAESARDNFTTASEGKSGHNPLDQQAFIRLYEYWVYMYSMLMAEI
eukprot:m.24205 g.24205  ORF g.24205 m.24205 type:complete len:66 (+) comp14501_c0_seq1:330-527(+)